MLIIHTMADVWTVDLEYMWNNIQHNTTYTNCNIWWSIHNKIDYNRNKIIRIWNMMSFAVFNSFQFDWWFVLIFWFNCLFSVQLWNNLNLSSFIFEKLHKLPFTGIVAHVTKDMDLSIIAHQGLHRVIHRFRPKWAIGSKKNPKRKKCAWIWSEAAHLYYVNNLDWMREGWRQIVFETH